jgi:hypothetical protein
MLLTPGQGLLTLLAGLLLMDFPGKYAMQRRLIEHPPILRAINRLRARHGHPPLRPRCGERRTREATSADRR